MRAIAKERKHHWPKRNHRDERLRSLAHSHIRYTIPSMLIAIEKPDSVAHTAEYMCLVDGDKFQRQHVEKESKQPRWAVSEVIDIELVKSQRDASIEEHPHVELKLWCIGDLVCLLMHGDLFVEIPVVYV